MEKTKKTKKLNKEDKKARKQVEEYNKKHLKEVRQVTFSPEVKKNTKGSSELKQDPKGLRNSLKKEEIQMEEIPVLEESTTPSSADFGIFGGMMEMESLDSAVKTVFETRKATEALNDLDHFVEQSEKEIEKLCNEQYQTFISSVDDLLLLKKETQTLKDATVRLNRDVQISGMDVINKAKNLKRCQQIRMNVQFAIERCQDCQFFLQLVQQFKDCLLKENKDYLRALKILKKIETIILPTMQGFSFAVTFGEELPKFKTMIKVGAKDEFSSWLFSLRNLLVDVGQLALNQNHFEIQQEEFHRTNRLRIRQQNTETPSLSTEYRQIMNEGLFSNKKYALNFSPLFKCKQVYEMLGVQSEFESLYRENRQMAAERLFQTPPKSSKFENFQNSLYPIVGFFVIEDTVAHSIPGLMPPTMIEKILGLVLKKIVAYVQEQVSFIMDAEALVPVKNFLVVFAKTLHHYSCNVSQLSVLLESIRDAYSDLKLNQTHTEFVKAMKSDDGTKFIVNNKKVFDEMILGTGLDSSSNPTLPMTCRFSSIVPQYFKMVARFITNFYEVFAKGLSDIDDPIQRSTVRLIHILNELYVEEMKMGYSLQHLIQAWVNLNTLESVKPEWDKILTRYNHQASTVHLHLLFTSSKKQLETLISDLIPKKVNEALPNVPNLWIPPKVPDAAHTFAGDFKLFMTSASLLLKDLPFEMQEKMKNQAFESLNNGIIEVLCSVPRYNLNGIKGLELDLKYLMAFGNECIGKKTLDHFQQLVQLVALFTTEADIRDQHIRDTNFPAFASSQGSALLLKLLLKYKEDSGFFTRKSAKERSIEDLIRILQTPPK